MCARKGSEYISSMIALSQATPLERLSLLGMDAAEEEGRRRKKWEETDRGERDWSKE